ncbi:MAG: hypothetical protein KFH98_14390 [Gemmatimonadetes bacterium]|nr:hypothetical protein [Gemmatimonadota bacterium]
MHRSIRLVASLPLAIAASLTAVPVHAQVVEITAIDYAFQAPETVPAGWNTIRFTNDGEEPHFVFMSRLPEGTTLADYETQASAAFSRGWTARRDGNASEEEALGMIMESLPPWFADLRMVGGPGFLASGLTSEVVFHLEPGRYVLECYVKTADGEIHYMEGMIRPMEVTAPEPLVATPRPDIRVTLTNDGMRVEGDLTAGRRVVAVHAQENPEVGFGHSAHLARLDADTDIDDVVQWMNWLAIDGMRAPAPVPFLGGIHAMPTGETAYFAVDLQPGRYLFISEATAHLGMLHEFTVR